jgi:hypothetical protein
LVLLDELLDFGLGNGFVQAISYKTRSARRIDMGEIAVVASFVFHKVNDLCLPSQYSVP